MSGACSQCGVTVDRFARFCSQCGASISEAYQPMSTFNISTQKRGRAKRESRDPRQKPPDQAPSANPSKSVRPIKMNRGSHDQDESTSQEVSRTVSTALFIGILFLPWFFSWFTLRKGYSPRARWLSFSWIILLSMINSTVRPSNESGISTNKSATTAKSYTAPSPNSNKLELLRSGFTFDYKWKKGGFDNVMLADFTISNPSEYQIKDITITCRHFANSGTEIDSNTRTVYEVVLAKNKKVIKDFNMGWINTQARSSSCEIKDLNFRHLTGDWVKTEW